MAKTNKDDMEDIWAAFDEIEDTPQKRQSGKSDNELTVDDLMEILGEAGDDDSDEDEITDEDIETALDMLDDTGDDASEDDDSEDDDEEDIFASLDEDLENRRQERKKEKVGFWKSLLGFKK